MAQDSAAPGERIAALEAQIADLRDREEQAAEERRRNSETLNQIAAQLPLIRERVEAIGAMTQIAKDFLTAAGSLPKREEYKNLQDRIHLADLELAKLQTEFALAKANSATASNRIWGAISLVGGAALSALGGLIVGWFKH